MTIEQEILEELRKRTPLAEIKKKFRSKSQTYEANQRIARITANNGF